jgi:hypothetical protein
MDTAQSGTHGGTGISAETAVTNASATPASNNNLFNILRSPRVFDLNSGNSRTHGKIKSESALKVKTPRDFRKAEQGQAANTEKQFPSPPFLLKGFGV